MIQHVKCWRPARRRICGVTCRCLSHCSSWWQNPLVHSVSLPGCFQSLHNPEGNKRGKGCQAIRISGGKFGCCGMLEQVVVCCLHWGTILKINLKNVYFQKTVALTQRISIYMVKYNISPPAHPSTFHTVPFIGGSQIYNVDKMQQTEIRIISFFASWKPSCPIHRHDFLPIDLS